MRHDKKVKAGVINYVIPKSIGEAYVAKDLADDTIINLIEEFKQRFN